MVITPKKKNLNFIGKKLLRNIFICLENLLIIFKKNDIFLITQIKSFFIALRKKKGIFFFNTFLRLNLFFILLKLIKKSTFSNKKMSFLIINKIDLNGNKIIF